MSDKGNQPGQHNVAHLIMNRHLNIEPASPMSWVKVSDTIATGYITKDHTILLRQDYTKYKAIFQQRFHACIGTLIPAHSI